MERSNGEGSLPGNGQEAVGKRRRRFRIFGTLVAACLAAGAAYWLLTRNHETTDDAFIEADVIQIAPQIGGVVVARHFEDNQWVDRGQLLLEIDPRDYEIQLASARAALAIALAQRQSARADLALTKATTGAAIDEAKNLVDQTKHKVSQARQQAEAAEADAVRSATDAKRYDDLFQRADVSRQRLDQAMAEARSTNARWRAAQLAATASDAERAQAVARLQDALAAPERIAQKEAQLANAEGQVEQAEADLRSAELNLSYTRIVAPEAGRIARRAVNVGDVVQKNAVLAALVVSPPWVTANFKETQLARIRPGQPVSISVDAFPGRRLRGRVDSIQAGSGARFSLLPAENATGNYVKVVQRVPVKIVFENMTDAVARMLAPGLSVIPDVDVGGPAVGKP